MSGQELQSAEGIADRVQRLREANRLSRRQLARNAGVAASYVSAVEAGRISPTIVTLRKLLEALHVDLGAFFFSENGGNGGDYVYRAGQERSLSLRHSRATYLFPRRPHFHLEVVDERLVPGVVPEFTVLDADFAGYVLEGEFILELEGDEPQRLRKNDAFYVHGGRRYRGYCAGNESVRLLDCYDTREIPNVNAK